jgi:magnesium-transporting ATPase (P-type)
MKSKIIAAETSLAKTNREEKRGIWHILWHALAPLYLLAIIGAIVIALVMLIRHLIDPTHFLLQQELFTTVMITGLAVAIIVYSIAVRYALKKIEAWRQSGHTTQANAGLIALTTVASMMILPVILALFFH